MGINCIEYAGTSLNRIILNCLYCPIVLQIHTYARTHARTHARASKHTDL